MKIIKQTIFIIFFACMSHNKCFDKNTWQANKGKNIVIWIKDNPMRFLLTLFAAGGIWQMLMWHQEWKGENEKKKIQENEKNKHKNEIEKTVQEYQSYVDEEYSSMTNKAIFDDENLAKVENNLSKVPPSYLFILRMKKIFEYIDEKIVKEINSNNINIKSMMADLDTGNRNLEYFNIIVYFDILEFVNNKLQDNVADALKKRSEDTENLALIEYERSHHLILEPTNNPFPFYVKVNSKIKNSDIKKRVSNFREKYPMNMDQGTFEDVNPINASYNPLLSYLLNNNAIYINPYCKEKNNTSNNRNIVKEIIKDEYCKCLNEKKNNITLADYIEALGINVISKVTSKLLREHPIIRERDRTVSLVETTVE